jgi:hypothetical protein
MISIVVQYLEDSPGLKDISPRMARDRLRQACQRLPISRLLLGWNLPAALMDAVAAAAGRGWAAFPTTRMAAGWGAWREGAWFSRFA